MKTRTVHLRLVIGGSLNSFSMEFCGWLSSRGLDTPDPAYIGSVGKIADRATALLSCPLVSFWQWRWGVQPADTDEVK